MKFLFLSAALFALSSAAHMNGIVQDALDACQKAKCPGSYELFTEMTTAQDEKKLDVKQWLTNMDYIFGDVPKMYPTVEKHLECVCKECSALVEPIWQPIGREACGRFSVVLPCQAELDACLAAGNSKEVCYPDNGIYGYKKGYDLSNAEECRSLCRNTAGENKPPCNPNDPLIKLQQCLATSRINGAKPIDVKIPCDRSANENGLCDGIAAEKCTFPTCNLKGTSIPCTPQSGNGRRLLFGGSALECECK